MTNERARDILLGIYSQERPPTPTERDQARSMGAAALAAQEELLDAVETLWRSVWPGGFNPGPRGLGPDSDNAWKITDALVKHGRVTKTDDGYRWSGK